MSSYFLDMERKHNLKMFFEHMLNTAESQELVDLVQEVQQGFDSEGNAKAFLGFNPDAQYGKSLMDYILSQPHKTPVIPMPKLSGRMISYVAYDDLPMVGEAGPAKPEPDWKHPIPVSVKSDGPSKQKRAKLRAKRKK